VHTDHLNTPRKVTRPSDNKARWTWESDPFGTALPNENPQALGTFKYNLRFPGQIYDSHTGLNYNYFRDYDAVTGRYIQSDPIGLQGGINTYAYVGSNPLGYVDPYGQVRWRELGSATLGLAGSAAGVVVGGTLFSAPTGLTQVLGGAIVVKSAWSWGTSWYSFTRALSDDERFDIPSQFQTLPRTASAMLSCGPTGERVADILDLSLDFASGRPNAGFLRNPSGYLRSPVGYPPINSNQFFSPVTVDRLMSPQFNAAANILQGTQSVQYVLDATK
jgi:RHS repeat-associated protein